MAKSAQKKKPLTYYFLTVKAFESLAGKSDFVFSDEQKKKLQFCVVLAEED